MAHAQLLAIYKKIVKNAALNMFIGAVFVGNFFVKTVTSG